MAELESASKETKAAGYMSHKEFCGKLNNSISKRGLTNTLSSVAVRVAGAPSLTWQTLVSVAAARKNSTPTPSRVIGSSKESVLHFLSSLRSRIRIRIAGSVAGEGAGEEVKWCEGKRNQYSDRRTNHE